MIEPTELVGRSLPTGRYTLTGHEHWLACDAQASPLPSGGTAHPMMAYFAALRGAGLPLSTLFEWFEAGSADGVMGGEATVTWWQPLLVGVSSEVAGEIVDADRKTGRSGTFDVIMVRDLIEGSDGLAATLTNAFIVPRAAAGVAQSDVAPVAD